MENPATTSLELLDRLLHRYPSDRLIRSIALLAGTNPQVRSALVSATIEHAQPGWRSLDLVHKFGAELPVHRFLSALTAGQRSLTRKRISILSIPSLPPLPHLEYAQAILTRQFVRAFDLWKEFPKVKTCLNSLPLPTDKPWSHTMAVVLPGPAEAEYGLEIDGHDLVGRTGLTAPTASEAAKVGTRFDYAFLNWNRFGEITSSVEALSIDARCLVVDSGFRHRPKPSWLTTEVMYELDRIETPTCPRTYMPLRIVPWCLRRGIRPTLYCADFYLGSTAYQSAGYDTMGLLETEDDNILSYLRHDVFFNHAALRHWHSHGAIVARGRLAELLELDDRSFAESIQNRWGKRIN